MSIDLKLDSYVRNGDRQERRYTQSGFKLGTGATSGSAINATARTMAINNTVGTPWNPLEGTAIMHVQTLSTDNLTVASAVPNQAVYWQHNAGLMYTTTEDDTQYYNMYLKLGINHKYVIGALMGQTALSGHELQPYAYMDSSNFYLLDKTPWGTSGKWIPSDYTDGDGNAITELPNNWLVRTGGNTYTQHTIFVDGQNTTTVKPFYLILRLKVAKSVYDADAEDYPNPKMTFAYVTCDKALQEYGTAFTGASSSRQYLLHFNSTSSLPNAVTTVDEDCKITTYYKVGASVTHTVNLSLPKYTIGTVTASTSAYEYTCKFKGCSVAACTMTLTYNGVTSTASGADTVVIGNDTYATAVSYHWTSRSAASATAQGTFTGITTDALSYDTFSGGTSTYTASAKTLNIYSIDSSFTDSVSVKLAYYGGQAYISGDNVYRNASTTVTISKTATVSTTPIAADTTAAYELDADSEDDLDTLLEEYDNWKSQIVGEANFTVTLLD